MNKVFLLIISLFAATHAFSADNDLAKIQSKLSLLGYDPGPVDGMIGRKTRVAINLFDATMQATATNLEELDRKLNIEINNAAKKQLALDIYKTTSNFTEMNNTEAYFLLGDDFFKKI